MRPMKIIDTHTHVFPDNLAAHATGAITVPGFYEPHYNGTLNGLIASMDTYGVTQAWTIPVATKAKQVDTINTFAQAQVANDRVVPFGAMHPDVENPRELLSTYHEMGFSGFKVHPDYVDCAPTDTRMEAIYEAAVDYNLIAYFHAGDDENHHDKVGNPREFAAVNEQYPDLKMVCAHFGSLWMWDEVEEHLVGRDNIWFDTAYTFGDRGISSEQFLRMAKAHGYDKITFGTDGPWTDPQDSLDFIKANASHIADNDLEWWMHGSAENLLELAR